MEAMFVMENYIGVRTTLTVLASGDLHGASVDGNALEFPFL